MTRVVACSAWAVAARSNEEIHGLVGDLVGYLMAGDFMDSEWAWGVISWNG